MKKERNHVFTIELLKQFGTAAFSNAQELLSEAELLASQQHMARAYFLAVASIEETGKAVMAFQAQGRNLSNPAIQNKIKECFDNHSMKISAAFAPVLEFFPKDDSSTAVLLENIRRVIGLAADIQIGREPSMYVDINPTSFAVNMPSDVVSPLAGIDCSRLASMCIERAQESFQKMPHVCNQEEDEFFLLKWTQIAEITQNENFIGFLLHRSQQGDTDFTKAVLAYRKDYVLKNRLFSK